MITAGMTAAEVDAIRARIEAKIAKRGPDECWIWSGATGQNDQPSSSLKKKSLSPRRLLWEITRGEGVPSNRQVGVRCDVQRCLNPAHLYLRPFGDDAARLWSLVKKAEGDACWEYQGMLNDRGYGCFTMKGRKVQAHRVAWELANGPIPKDGVELCVCHRCDNPKCVRPDHLFLGTDADNIADCVAKGRNSRGPKHAAAMAGRPNVRRITPEQAAEVRRLRIEGLTQTKIAASVGIAPGSVSRVLRGETGT